jgi:hypothetical protein
MNSKIKYDFWAPLRDNLRLMIIIIKNVQHDFVFFSNIFISVATSRGQKG